MFFPLSTVETKELVKHIESMSYSEAMVYLMRLSQRHNDAIKTKNIQAFPQLFTQNYQGKSISFDI